MNKTLALMLKVRSFEFSNKMLCFNITSLFEKKSKFDFKFNLTLLLVAKFHAKLQTVLPHLVNFHNSCEFQALIATQKGFLRLANFLRILTFKIFF